MDRNYIKFIIAYDFCKRLEEMELACDEAFDLVDEIANRYIKYTEENEIEQHYETLYDYCEKISFDKVWKQMNKNDENLIVYHVGFNDNDETEVDALNAEEAIELAKVIAKESGVEFELDYVYSCGYAKN